MSTATETTTLPLKRLGFVQSTASYLYSYTYTAEKVYKKVRTAVPRQVEPTLTKLEDTVIASVAPVVAKATDVSEKLLHVADNQVDSLFNTTSKTVASGKKGVSDTLGAAQDMHTTNTKTFSQASATYYDWLQQLSDWAKDKLNPVTGGQAAVATLNAAIAKAKEATDPDVAAQIAVDAWNKFSSVPVVAKLLDTADPVTKASLNTFYKLHDNVVSWTVYKRAVDTSASTLGWATTTFPYKLGAQYIYPVVKPVADPAIDKISHSKVIKQAVNYWRPTAVAA